MSFSLTRKTDYALVALAALARESAASGGTLSARQLAEDADLPLPLLMNTLKELHRAEIISSRRGVGGGYYLGRAPEEISLKEVIEALEGPINVTLCSGEHADDGNELCRILSLCQISAPMRKFNHILNDFLNRVTLGALTETEEMLRPTKSGVKV